MADASAADAPEAASAVEEALGAARGEKIAANDQALLTALVVENPKFCWSHWTHEMMRPLLNVDEMETDSWMSLGKGAFGEARIWLGGTVATTKDKAEFEGFEEAPDNGDFTEEEDLDETVFFYLFFLGLDFFIFTTRPWDGTDIDADADPEVDVDFE